jgi:hypothetical protein
MKVISFSLWGDNPEYSIGAIVNADIAKEQWPEWVCRYYVAPTVPSSVIEELDSRDNVEIVREDVISNILDVKIKGGTGWEGEPFGMFWRMIPASESDVEVVIIRDVDSRLHIRDKMAVEEWIESDKDFHIMRDNCQHGLEMCGGLWGVKNHGFSDAADRIKEYVKENTDDSNHDQFFLKNLFSTRAMKNSYVHDDWFPFNKWYASAPLEDRTFTHHPFPIPRLRGDGWWNQEFPEWHGGIEDDKEKYPHWFGEDGQGHCFLKCSACGEFHDNEYLGKAVAITKEEQKKYLHLLNKEKV